MFSLAFGYFPPSTELCISLCWTLWGCWPISPACQGIHEWQHNHLMYQLFLPNFLKMYTLALVKKLNSIDTSVNFWNTPLVPHSSAGPRFPQSSFCCWYSYRKASCCFSHLLNSAPLGFLTLSDPISSFCAFPFYVWLKSGAPCSIMWVSCYHCLASYILRWSIVELPGGDPWKLTSSPGPLFSLGLYPMWFL